MDLSSSDVVLICDRLGIVAFSLAGVEAGLQRRLDVFGLLVLGIVTAAGGGVMRDTMLGTTPLLFENPDFLLLAVGASLVAIIAAVRGLRLPEIPKEIADAAGLGAFTVAGTFAAIQAGLPYPAVLIVAVVTSNGGGVVRDLLISRVPMVLRSELGATAAILGATATWAMESTSPGLAAIAGLSVTALVRLTSAHFDIHLPVPVPRREQPPD